MNNQILNSIQTRELTNTDIGFVFNSWLKSYKNSPIARCVPTSVFYSGQHKLIEHLIANSTTIVACSKEDPLQIFGYICASRVQGILVVHYIYVKQTYRMLGVGKMLLNHFDFQLSSASCYTHRTETGDRLSAKFNMVYHPYLAMNIYNDEEKDANTGDKAINGRTLAINAAAGEKSIKAEAQE